MKRGGGTIILQIEVLFSFCYKNIQGWNNLGFFKVPVIIRSFIAPPRVMNTRIVLNHGAWITAFMVMILNTIGFVVFSMVPLFQKISYTFLSLEKRPRHVQGCYTAQKMRKDLLFPTHDDSYHLNNYWSLYALICRHSLQKNAHIHAYFVNFLKESVDKWTRSDSGNCSNDMNCRALERWDLCASFEPYSNLVRGVVASLSLKMYDLFF